MRKFRKFMAALLVLATVLAMTGTAFAAAKLAKGDYVVFKGSAYGYNKPNAGSRSGVIVMKNSAAQVVEISKDKKWALLRLGLDKNAKKLWFDIDKYLKKYSGDGATVQVVYAAGGSGKSKPIYENVNAGIKGTVKVTGDVNLRKTPSLQGKSYGTLKKGSKVTLTGKIGVDDRFIPFVQVKANGGEYYVSMMYLKLSEAQADKVFNVMFEALLQAIGA